MQKRMLALPIILTILTALPLISNALTTKQTQTTIINTDGDLSLSEQENRQQWNPHTCGFLPETQATVTYTNHTATIHLKKTTLEPGHIATGAWWTTSFQTRQKTPIYNTHIQATFQALLTQAAYTPGNEWLRIALASAVQRADGLITYTELDFYDSPNTQNHPTGNINQGGSIIYKGADIVEYKTPQIPLNQWTNFTFDITNHINQAWNTKPGDLLESVYIVIETANTPTEITSLTTTLWLTQTT